MASINISEFEAHAASGIVTVQRLAQDYYQVVWQRWKRENGQPDAPDVMQLNREAVATLAKDLRAQMDKTRAELAANERALKVLTEILPARFDALDSEATK